MKISEVVRRIEAYHPYLPDYNGCDGYKAGSPDQECTGIACALVPTIDVIRRAAELGCNFLYIHEPSYYQTPDYPAWKGNFRNRIYEEKRALLEEYGITVYRDHDHTHAHQPDGIFTGVIKYLGWDSCRVPDEDPQEMCYLFEIPETTVRDLNRYLMERIGMRGVRYIGRPDTRVSRVAIVPHIYPGAFIEEKYENGYYDDLPTRLIRKMEEQHIQVIIPGEIVEWNLLSYINDAAMLGHDVACLNIGHFNMEELGARYAADWIRDLCQDTLPVHYVHPGELWNFQI